MPEETQATPETAPPKPTPKKKRAPGKWFRKIPKNILFSPGGIILIFFALFMEILDPFIPGGALTIEIIPEVIFCLFLAVIAKLPFQSLIAPILIERIPIISDILPTWLIRMFI